MVFAAGCESRGKWAILVQHAMRSGSHNGNGFNATQREGPSEREPRDIPRDGVKELER